MSIELKKATGERDFLLAMELESRISAACALDEHARHIGGLIFERFLLGESSAEFFDYCRLIYIDGALAGYALCFIDDGEYELDVLKEYRNRYKEIIEQIDALFEGRELSTEANTLDAALTDALCSYERLGEASFLAGLLLDDYTPRDVCWENETLRPLTQGDIENRAAYGHLPTGRPLAAQRYSELMQSPYYAYALDYVVTDNKSGSFAAYLTWWLDEKSKTALLEPVACLEEYRRRGIMQRALLSGLNELKERGFKAAYVSTSMKNVASRPLYMSVGFQKIGEAYEYVKHSSK